MRAVQRRFLRALREDGRGNQQKRKNLQGNITLYISPKLFHIWLWVDWWDTYGTTFSWQAITELPEKLKDWFFEMFEYARESQVSSPIFD